MRVHHYANCWNEVRILPFFFRHYESLVDRFVIYDDGSTDGSLDILRKMPRVEIRQLERADPDSFVLSSQALFNQCWKESRGNADWVIVSNVDEHLFHSDLFAYLRRCRAAGITAIPALGYQMIAAGFPPADAHLSLWCSRGAPLAILSKLFVFNPIAISETNFAVGRHTAAPSGDIRYPDRDELLGLHYKYLGRDYVLRRYAELNAARRKLDLATTGVLNTPGRRPRSTTTGTSSKWRRSTSCMWPRPGTTTMNRGGGGADARARLLAPRRRRPYCNSPVAAQALPDPSQPRRRR